MFGKLKHYRRIVTRYEKKAINYIGMPVVCLSFMVEMKRQQSLEFFTE